jgi:uncharacterized protein YkwD
VKVVKLLARPGLVGWAMTLVAAMLVTMAVSIPARASTPTAASAHVIAPRTATGPLAGAAAPASFDQQMIALVNQARSAAGVAKLTEAKGLVSLALWWSNQMSAGATAYNLAHNPDAWTMVTSYGAANRTSWGENVAWSSSTATTAAQIFAAYMNSPGHKANILSRSYRYIGMGTTGGTHGLFNTTEFTDNVQAGQAVVPVAAVPTTTNSLSDGDFIRNVSSPAIYRLVGGAPIYVSSWAPFGGGKPFKLVTDVKFASLPQYPANGAFLRTPDGAVYRVVGGAPVYVSSWASVGGPKAWMQVDPAALAHAGGAGVWSHLSNLPADGTVVRTPGNGAIYRIAGGAPLYVSSWAPFGRPLPFTEIDSAAVAHAGAAGVFAHLRWAPADNTVLVGAGTSALYRVVGGKVSRLASRDQVGGTKNAVVVDPKAIALAGTNQFYNHLGK